MAKICPKCGREYEGDSCPYCEKPKILVNQEAYEKRKAVYERAQQGGRKGEIRRKGSAGPHRRRKTNVSPIVRKLYTGLDFLYERLLDLIWYLRKFRRKIITAAAVCLLLLICVFAGRGIWSWRHTYLWVFADGVTSQVDGDTLTQVDGNQLTFWSDTGKAYFSDLPDDLADGTIQETAVSEGGQYFAAVVYTAGRNVVCRWKNGDPNGYQRLATESSDVDLCGISDSGALFYLLSTSSEENWAYSGSGFAVYFARSGGSSVRVGIDVTQFHGTPSEGSAIYIKDGDLHFFQSDENGGISDEVIAEYISDLQVPDPVHEGVFTNTNGTVLESGSKYIYRSDGTYWLSDGKSTEKIWDSDASLIFFMSGDKAVYAYDSSGIWTEENGVLVKTTSAAADSTYVWLADSKKLLFTNDQGEVCVLSGRKMEVLMDGLTGAKLSYVEGFRGAAVGTDSSVTLIRPSGETQVLEGAFNAEQVVVFRGNTYAVGEDGQLFVYDKNYSRTSPGSAVRIWIQQ